MRKIRIAQIGVSEHSHGSFVFSTLKKQTELYEIVGYCLPEGEREKFPVQAEGFAGYPELSLEEILTDDTIDAVAVETEEIYLTKYALLAAQAGKHIHMEKPGGVSLQEFEELVATMKKSGKIFHTGYMYRYNPEIIELLRQIKAGDLGEILCVEAQMNCAHSKEVRQWLETFCGGSTFFLGCHLIDLIMQIQGLPQRVLPLNKRTNLDGTNAEDFGMAVLEYPHGVSFAKVNSNEIGGFMRRQLVVTGSKKTVEIKPLEIFEGDKQYSTVTEYAEKSWRDGGKTRDSERFDRYEPMMAAFAAMVSGEWENPNDYDYELELYKTVLRCAGKL